MVECSRPSPEDHSLLLGSSVGNATSDSTSTVDSAASSTSSVSPCHWVIGPLWRFFAWFRLLADHFGMKFIMLVFFGEHLLKGFMDGGGASGSGFLVIENIAYVQLQVGASTKNILLALSGASWCLKPVFGMVSDTLVIGGYRRQPWIIITALLATAAYTCIFMFGHSIGPYLLCLCFFFIRTQTAWTDLMVEAVYTEKMQSSPEQSADIVTWVWSGIGVATIAGVLVVGPGLDLLGPFTMAGLAIPLSAAIIIPACLGWLGERPCTNPSCGVQWDLLHRQRPLYICSIILSIIVIISSVCAMLELPLSIQVAIAVGGSLLVILASVALLPPGFWKPMLFMFLSCAISINTYGFIENFYLDAPTAEVAARTGSPVCHNCPHFSNTFYVTIIGICDSLFMMVGSWLFNDSMSHWTYRKSVVITTVLLSAATLLDIVQFQRWNVQYGVPDTMFMIFKRAVQGICAMVNFMPTTILISKLCPEGAESIVFSLLAGFSNFGITVSAFLGAYILEWIGMDTIGQGGVDDFSNAWQACLVNALTPLLALLFLSALIPDARMDDLLAVRALGEYEIVIPDEILDKVSFTSGHSEVADDELPLDEDIPAIPSHANPSQNLAPNGSN